MTDNLPECREAFERIFVKHFPTKSVHRFACKEIWQASRSAFAAELEKKIKSLEPMAGFSDYDSACADLIALIRQMAGEK